MGLFLKVLGDNFLTKVVQILDNYLLRHILLVKNSLSYFLGNFCMNLGYFLFQQMVTLNSQTTSTQDIYYFISSSSP